jgi:membrane-associated phospholipid phosphatase
MTIKQINQLALDLVQRDFSPGVHPSPSNGGPTKTSRALAIIHLAAHDAYAKVTGLLNPQLPNLPAPPISIGTSEAAGITALIGAGIHAAEQLYPNDAQFIAAQTSSLTTGLDVATLAYGEQIADFWLTSRRHDNSDLPQLDTMYSDQPGLHRPDPLNPSQQALGRNWRKVTPFVISDVTLDAFLEPPPTLTSQNYALAFDQVIEQGKNDITQRDPDFRKLATVGIFWGYDGANLLGTPPRLYNEVVRGIDGFDSLPAKEQIRILTAINAAQADAAIAAWFWKYEYDVWRPVVGIREADSGFGPTGLGDNNTLRGKAGDPFWLPLGAPKSNPFPGPAAGAPGSNFTPNFPAYPSGHATFGSAAFETAAALLGKTPEDVMVTNFVSGEFNGKTTDNTGTTRPKWQQTFNLREAIEQNKLSRIYLGVHWIFDATGGETVGKAIAQKVVTAFS